MPVLRNRLGDTVTVECGGFGGDNVLGTVEDRDGVPVGGATVTIGNQSRAGEVGEDTTGNSGRFDVDVDAASGDLIVVHATWKDVNGGRHVVVGTFRCPKVEEEEGAARPTEDRLERIGRLEEVIEERVARVAGGQVLINGLHGQLNWLVNEELNALRELEDGDQQKERLDQGILKEIHELENKFESARSFNGPPPEDLQWAIQQEMFNLLKKLVSKAFILQGLPAPEFRPGPGDLT